MELNTDLKIQILLFVISFIVLVVLMRITKGVTKRITIVKELEPNRKKVVLNLFYFLYYIIFITTVVLILGINLDKLTVFFSSILAILGISFFAQWSLLSNLTASVILFFYHPLKISDKIKILDKDFDFIGVVKNITGFYVSIVTEDDKVVTIPNSVIIQKGIEYIKS